MEAQELVELYKGDMSLSYVTDAQLVDDDMFYKVINSFAKMMTVGTRCMLQEFVNFDFEGAQNKCGAHPNPKYRRVIMNACLAALVAKEVPPRKLHRR